MSEQAKQKTYVNGVFVKTQKTNFGDIIKLSCKVDDLVAFLNQYQENGWVSIDLLQKKQVDEKGRTHTAVLNDYKPNGQSAKPVQVAAGAGDSDLPF